MYLRKTSVLVFIFLISACAFAVSAPAVTSSTHPAGEWSSNRSASVSWDAVAGATKYEYAYDSASDTIPDGSDFTTETSLTLPAKQEGIFYFHVRSFQGSNASETTHYTIQIDSTGPKRPKVTATPEGLYVRLEWEESSDNLSGVKGYEIYKNKQTGFEINDPGVEFLGTFTGTGYLDTNEMTEGRTYFYKVAAVDNADNRGIISAEAKAKIPTFCTLGIVLGASLSSDKSKLIIDISSADPIYYSNLYVTPPNKPRETLFSDKSDYNSWQGEIDLAGVSQGEIFVDLKAKEFYGDNCDTNLLFLYDTVLPTIDFIFPKNYREELSETVTLNVQVQDSGDYKSGIGTVEFFYKLTAASAFISLGTPDLNNGYYVMDWNTLLLPNEYYTFKVSASDKAGNTVEAEKPVWIFNTGEIESDVNSLIFEAYASLDLVEEKEGILLGMGIESPNMRELKTQGIEALEIAERSFSERAFSDAVESANFAKDFFAQAQSAIDLNVMGEEEFVFNDQQIGLLLEAVGLSPELISHSEFLIQQSNVSRKLQIMRVSDLNTVYFKPIILISFGFSESFLLDNNISAIGVIEYVPKEFAASASDIVSSREFKTLKEDPTISFSLDKEFFDSGKTLSYGLSSELTEAEAMAFLNDHYVNKFVAPPVLMNPDMAPGVPIPIGFDWFPIVLGAVVVVLVLVLLLILMRRPKKSKFEVPKKKFGRF
ncbi:MAG: hypothetical protein JW772_02735 [Candidatus Diapherotrites archaeon]|nr:hypothetical protein [Candidatus Diapherotrites archaeon]